MFFLWDWFDYLVMEYVLCGFFFGGVVVCFIVVGYVWVSDEICDVMEVVGGGLLLLGGVLDLVCYVVDMLSFFWCVIELVGCGIWFICVGVGLGVLFWLVGFVGNWLN